MCFVSGLFPLRSLLITRPIYIYGITCSSSSSLLASLASSEEEKKKKMMMIMMGLALLQVAMDVMVAGISFMLVLGIFAFVATILCSAAFLQAIS
ncbi:uncharacterized protein LOC103717712 [Phoenix dactylifera]|uniref:Uncharacterized protein LOC103717712 n=1 Tax=Phoenix dactylifera TaxID=42345 RepID=A0A8B8JA66_PHODC|nr:uncharacterized protein LOC103717712 [Phoenix dactylifera]